MNHTGLEFRSSILQNSLSCFSLKIHLQDLWKRFQFVLDHNLGHFEVNLFDRAEIVMEAGKYKRFSGTLELEIWTKDKTHVAWCLASWLKNYPIPPCAPSGVKSGLIPILHQYFTHSLHVYAGDTITSNNSNIKSCISTQTLSSTLGKQDKSTFLWATS